MKKVHLIYLSVIAILFTGLLYLLYLNFYKPDSTSPPTTNITPTETPDLTADWKTYVNNDYGFEFKYPEKYKQISLNNSICITVTEPDNDYGGCDISISPQNLTSSEEKNIQLALGLPTNISLKEFSKQSGWDYQEKRINNHNWIIFHQNEGPGEGVYHNYVSSKNLIVDITVSSDLYKSNELFQILSTFKFIEPTSNWKIYQDDNLGIEIKYPNGWEVAPGPEDNSFQVKLIVPEEMFYHQIVFSKTNAKNFDGVLKELFEQDDVLASINPNVKPEKVILNSYIASKAVINTALGLPSVNILVTSPKGNSILIEHLQTQESSDIFTIHQKILSTFKFTQ